MVAAALAREAGFRLLALTVDYNQRHRIELQAAAAIAGRLGAERHIVLPLDLSRFGGSALTDDIAVPKGGLGRTTSRSPTSPRATPSSSRSAWAGPRRRARATSSSASTRSIIRAIPIAGPTSSRAFEAMANLATKAGVEGERFRVHTPLIAMTKADIVREAARLGLDAGMSWSCYDPAPDRQHCGLCDSCRLRAKGFAEAGLPDPTRYAASAMSYAVKEIFLTLQGEGMQAGRRAVFLRFAGCNLWTGREEDRAEAQCNFCDTDFVGMDGENGGRYEAGGARRQGRARCGARRSGRLVVITGGEPMLQLDAALIDALHARGFEIAVESNGTLPAPAGHRLDLRQPQGGHRGGPALGRRAEAGLAAAGDRPRRAAGWDFRHFLIQPMDCADARGRPRGGDRLCAGAIRDWRLSLQTHKLLGLP